MRSLSPAREPSIYPEKIAIFMRQLQDTIRSNYSFPGGQLLNDAYPVRNQQPNLHSEERRGGAVPDPTQESTTASSTSSTKTSTRNLKLRNIANKFNYNEQYIARLFKSLGSVSLHQYILNQRISQANYYLSETSLSIKEIAQKLGYHDSHNFMKIYKRETGLTPSEYQEFLSQPAEVRYMTYRGRCHHLSSSR